MIGIRVLATNPDISLPVNLSRFLIPKAEDGNFAFRDENGIELVTGEDANYTLGATGVSKTALGDAVQTVQRGILPQTLTVTYAKLHLVAGMTVNLNYNFASADLNFNDLALATLTDQSNQTFQGIQSACSRTSRSSTSCTATRPVCTASYTRCFRAFTPAGTSKWTIPATTR